MAPKHASAVLALALVFFIAPIVSASSFVVNPGFESGNTGFTTDYHLAQASDSSPLGICQPEGIYLISTSPYACHAWWADFGDHTSGSGRMMIVNGDVSVGSTVWQQTVDVDPFTSYSFAAFFASAHPVNPATLKFSINGSVFGSTVQLTSQTGLWSQFSTLWNSGNSTSATLALLNANVLWFGNDFAVDDISFAPVPPLQTTQAAVPEPATLLLVGMGLVTIVRQLRRTAKPRVPGAMN